MMCTIGPGKQTVTVTDSDALIHIVVCENKFGARIRPAIPGFPVLSISRFSASSYKGWSRVYIRLSLDLEGYKELLLVMIGS